MDYRALLNEEQLAPVVDTQGAVLVLAGAGSGKTRVLTYRIAYLVEQCNVNPYNILAITFTNKAAGEMKERVRQLINTSDPFISTFHSMCAKILRWEIDKLEGFSSNFSIYDDSDCSRIITRALGEMGVDEAVSLKEFKKDIRWHISNAKNHAMNSKDYEPKLRGENNGALIASVYDIYEKTLMANNALDFDDLLLKTVQLFAKNKDVLAKYQERFQYIMVDEFQDTNKIQYTLVRLLAAKYGNIFVVGDDDQSIYGWRWAEVANITNFSKHFPGARMYKLQQNYRSTANILNLANTIIGNNVQRMGKTLWTQGDKGVNVVYQSNWDEKSEADYVLDQINGLIRRNGYKFGDFAILTRINSITRPFEEKLALYNYPYKVIGGNKFYDRKEIKDFMAYLKFVCNPSDTESILRVINVPKRGIGDGAIDKLVEACLNSKCTLIEGILNLSSIQIPSQVANKVGVFAEIACHLINNKDMVLEKFIDLAHEIIRFDSMYDKTKEEDRNRLDNIADFVSSVKEFCKDNNGCTLAEYLQSVALISDNEEVEDGDCIKLATIHGVKGLEYRCVFVIGLEEGIFPSSYKDTLDEIQEERRIMYVAVTRARERLYLTSAQSRFRFGKREFCKVSRFVEEGGLIKKSLPVGDDVDFAPRIPAFDFSTISRKTPAFATAQPAQQSTLSNNISQYKVGMMVEHTRFGKGIIEEITGENAKIKFEGLGMKMFNLRLAPIKII